MKIYDYKGFPNPARVRIALAEKGLLDRVEFVHVDVPKGEHKTPEFLAKNPSAAVPLLELDDGTYISECVAITEYLDHIAGEPLLTGQEAQDRAQIAMIQRKVESGLMDAAGAYFHHATPGLGPEIETYQNAEWGEKQGERALVTMRWMDEVLARREFLSGDSFTIADITAIAGLGFADFAGLKIPAGCDALSAYHARMSARPSVADAF